MSAEIPRYKKISSSTFCVVFRIILIMSLCTLKVIWTICRDIFACNKHQEDLFTIYLPILSLCVCGCVLAIAITQPHNHNILFLSMCLYGRK